MGYLALLIFAATVHAQQQAAQPWMDPGLPAEQRAHFALQAITLDGKLQLVHGTGWGVLRDGDPIAPGHNGAPDSFRSMSHQVPATEAIIDARFVASRHSRSTAPVRHPSTLPVPPGATPSASRQIQLLRAE